MTPTPTPIEKRSPGTFYYLQVIIGAALVLATLFVFWIPTGQPAETKANLSTQPAQAPVAGQPTVTPNPYLRVGIVAGHWSKDPSLYDPGAVCDDSGTTELEINLAIATKVRDLLTAQGYTVDLLEEWDGRLAGYRAMALISIHADSCVFVNEAAKGFKISPPMSNPRPENSARLVGCMIDRYTRETNMPQHRGSITHDMTDYHAFAEINGDTPAAIIETGFLRLDYQRLTEDQDTLARGVANGILCFLRNESTTSTTLEPTQIP